jgi:hypothetical protein
MGMLKFLPKFIYAFTVPALHASSIGLRHISKKSVQRKNLNNIKQFHSLPRVNASYATKQ